MRLKLLQIIISAIFISCSTFAQYSYSKPLNLVTLQYPPYEYEENGEIKGMAVSIVREVFKRMGQPIEIKLYPWARALRMVKEGQADGIFTAYKNPEREKFALYSKGVLMPQSVSLCTLKHKDFKLDKNLTNLKNYKIGIVHKVSYGRNFDNAVKNNIINRTVKSYSGEENFERLLIGYLDFAVSNTYGAIDILCKIGKRDQISILSPPIQEVPSYIAFSKKRNLLGTRDKFDIILSTMKADGTYDEIIKSYTSCSPIN
ncbi:MAG: transporter substrate-binding domain-containing protein [bacterium]|nr:transporter substrate-binding domain-containing protein [bacterium]